MLSLLGFAYLLLSSVSSLVAADYHLKEQERDRITKLPGQPENVNFSQYSGYINCGPASRSSPLLLVDRGPG